MKRSQIITLLAIGITTQSYTAKDISTSKKTIKSIPPIVGIMPFASRGYFGGYAGGAELAKRMKRQPKKYHFAMAIDVPLGFDTTGKDTIGGYIRKKANILYLSKKYKVSRRIALASLIAKVSLDTDIKTLFISAERKDTAFLKGFFATYYANQWKEGEQFFTVTLLSYVLSMLYFGQPFPSREAHRNRQARHEASRRLFNALFGK